MIRREVDDKERWIDFGSGVRRIWYWIGEVSKEIELN